MADHPLLAVDHMGTDDVEAYPRRIADVFVVQDTTWPGSWARPDGGQDAGGTIRGRQEKTPGVRGSAVTRSHRVAVLPNVSSRVRFRTPA